MKRLVLTLVLGLVTGFGSYWGYSQLHAPPATDSLEGQLVWMKSELKLTDAQYTRIRALHRASHAQLEEMAVQVTQMQAEFAEFEQTRRTAGRVDFVEFARFVESWRHLNQACLDSTRRLVRASAEIMTPQQRERYLHLVTNAEPLVGTLLH